MGKMAFQSGLSHHGPDPICPPCLGRDVPSRCVWSVKPPQFSAVLPDHPLLWLYRSMLSYRIGIRQGAVTGCVNR